MLCSSFVPVSLKSQSHRQYTLSRHPLSVSLAYSLIDCCGQHNPDSCAWTCSLRLNATEVLGVGGHLHMP